MPAAHLRNGELEDFLLGRLADDDHARVEGHLGDCPVCQSAAAGRSAGDKFTDLLVAAETRENVARAAAATPSTAGVPTLDKPAPAGAVPPGFVDHPRYRLVRRLGTGGMGTVWLAEHLVLHRQVAVKVIRPEVLSQPDAAERFHREARAVATLSHPNIVAAYDAEEAGGSLFLAMEYVPGENLAERVRSNGPLPVAEACRAARDTALALAAAHAAGLIHRDVKPHNLIRTPDGTTKVLDFGLATATAAAAGDLTGPGMIVGTPDYIAPEQAEDPHVADARSDVYALGCTLYHLLAGRPPFPGGFILKKLDAHRNRKPHAIEGLPAGLSAVLDTMTAKRPGRRFPTAEAVAAALSPFCEPQPVQPTSRRRWPAIAGLLVAAAGVAAAVVVVIVRDKDGKEIGRLTVPDGGKVEVVTPAGAAGPPVIPAERVLTGPIQRTRRAVFSANGKTVYSCSDDGFVRAWDVATGRETAAFDVGERVLSIALARGGKVLLVVTEPVVRCWDLATGRETNRFPAVATGERLCGVAVSRDGARAATVSIAGTIRVWDVSAESLVRTWKVEDPGAVYGVAWAPDGKWLATAGEALCVWDADTGKRVSRAVFPSGQTGVAFTADGTRLIACGWEGIVRVCDPATGRAEREIVVRERLPGTVCVITADGRLLIGAADNAVTVWDLATGGLLARLAGHTAQSLAPAVSADGKYAAAGSEDKTVCIWKLPPFPGSKRP